MTVDTPEHPTPGTDTEQVLRFLSVGAGFKPFAQQEGETTLGDHFVYHDLLRDMNDNVVGRDAGTCTLVTETSWQVNVTMELPEGCITAQGFVEDQLGLLAITGGTENYRYARGDVRISHSCDEGLDVTLRLSGVLRP
ncbi:hypothetical protein [Micromonospora sp. NPDC047134]|uniref:hypothetical protein n=1 Tax=Micromonospora sp. NPDC047134 TaxID=3154340 RepID=UPI0033DA4F83